MSAYSISHNLVETLTLRPSHHHHLFLNCEGHWGTTDDFATTFLHFSRFSTALWDLPNSRPVHPWCCLPTSSSVCLVFFPFSLCLARWFWPDLMNGRHYHTTAVCVSLQWSGGLCMVQLPAGSWHGTSLLVTLVFVWDVWYRSPLTESIGSVLVLP